ncbi:alpha/beta fold hydrolase [Sphingomonas sp. S2-65]|uniref:alpha/beta fold hydrolase n=1 Tax=Sphingomonas sp. S2-65 TaxID=2903960 RepID=UPI001F1E51E1|nr:alpha/beta hydrolase [Sphingomonas sp. S2-65]UYY58061.1 alpha/beta hydrolase [Sphingomonas sp. S2-65]
MNQGSKVRTSAAYVDGVRIHFSTAGEQGSPVLLLIHGYPEMGIAWRKTVEPLLAAGFRLVMPDLRGAGGSARPPAGYDKLTLAGDLAGMLDQLGVTGPVTVVGHDIGAMVAYAFARRFPERTSRLAILDSVIPGTRMFDEVSRDGTKVWHFHFHQAPDLPEALTQGREALYLERYYHDMAFDASAIDYEAFQSYVRNFSQPGGMRAGFELYRSFAKDVSDNRRLQAEQGALRMPVLALAGAGGRYADRIGPMMEEVAADVSVGVIPGAGHWLAEENPQAVADALTAFANGRSGEIK